MHTRTNESVRVSSERALCNLRLRCCRFMTGARCGAMTHDCCPCSPAAAGIPLPTAERVAQISAAVLPQAPRRAQPQPRPARPVHQLLSVPHSTAAVQPTLMMPHATPPPPPPRADYPHRGQDVRGRRVPPLGPGGQRHRRDGVAVGSSGRASTNGLSPLCARGDRRSCDARRQMH
jgi:hypothetical protein